MDAHVGCRILISIGGEDVFRFGGADPEAALLQTLGALNRLLRPEMGDSAPLYVGQAMPLFYSNLFHLYLCCLTAAAPCTCGMEALSTLTA